MKDMTDQVVVVTGASGGVGRATARAFAARGARLGLIARGERGLAAAAAEVERAGGTALPVSADTSDFAALRAAAQRVEDHCGPIEVWVNNAFTSVFAPFIAMTPEEFRRVCEVNYLGYAHGTKIALESMLPRDRGAVVQVGSALAYRGIPLQSAYCGSKHAIQGFHESVRTELLHAGSKVRTTMVQLPGTNTPQFDWVRSKLRWRPEPVPPIYQPEIAANAIVYAATHPKRREYWVGGSTVGTLLANNFAAGLLDRYLARTAFAAQQTQTPEARDEPENLWQPADGRDGQDFGAHGRFDAAASRCSPQVWASQHHGVLGLLGAGMAAAAVALATRGRR